jgi:hypothetical protein
MTTAKHVVIIELDPTDLPESINDAMDQLAAIRAAWSDAVDVAVDRALADAERRRVTEHRPDDPEGA